MRFFAVILCLVLPVAAKPPKKPVAALPPNVRLMYASGHPYASGTPYQDGILTVAHGNIAPGQRGTVTQNSITVAFTITGATRILVPKISPGDGLENRAGDLSFLTIEPKLPYWMARAELDPKLMHGAEVQVTHQDGVRSKRHTLDMGFRQAAKANPAQPFVNDLVNPRWMIFISAGKARPIVNGDSGGGIYRGRYLTSLISRGNAGPAFAHPDVRAALLSSLKP